MTAKLLVLAAAASAFVQPSAPRTKLTKRFFFDQFIPNPEADAELDKLSWARPFGASC